MHVSFRGLRIAVLLGILAGAGGLTWAEQSIVRSWDAPLQVIVVPINGDGSEASATAIARLRTQDFDDIEAFLIRETARYGVKQARAMEVRLTPELHDRPPAPPHADSRNAFDIMLWSLQLRGWVYRHSDSWLPQIGTIRLFVLYHAPHEGEPLAHSLGLQKGLIGVVNVFADEKQAAQNHVVIAHELLHTLGATDKYDAEGRPVYPQGYADPELGPHVPRRDAEIMAGRLIASDGRAVMPSGLARCVIGAQTAHEINLDEGFRRRFGDRS